MCCDVALDDEIKRSFCLICCYYLLTLYSITRGLILLCYGSKVNCYFLHKETELLNRSVYVDISRLDWAIIKSFSM